jgi:hypothetical protein
VTQRHACENDPERAAVGINGNGQYLCAECVEGDFAYAWQHVPEAFERPGARRRFPTREEARRLYVAECVERLNGGEQ